MYALLIYSDPAISVRKLQLYCANLVQKVFLLIYSTLLCLITFNKEAQEFVTLPKASTALTTCCEVSGKSRFVLGVGGKGWFVLGFAGKSWFVLSRFVLGWFVLSRFVLGWFVLGFAGPWCLVPKRALTLSVVIFLGTAPSDSTKPKTSTK
jgi:hypothetical protein